MWDTDDVKSDHVVNGAVSKLAVIADDVKPEVQTEVFVPEEIAAEVRTENYHNTYSLKNSDGEENDNSVQLNTNFQIDSLSLNNDELNLENSQEEDFYLKKNPKWFNREQTRSPLLCSDITFTEENEITMALDNFPQQRDSGTSSVTSFTFVNEERAMSQLDNVSNEKDAEVMFHAATLGKEDDPGYQTRHASEEQDITFDAKTLERATNTDESVEAITNGIENSQNIFKYFQTTNYTLVLSSYY